MSLVYHEPLHRLLPAGYERSLHVLDTVLTKTRNGTAETEYGNGNGDQVKERHLDYVRWSGNVI